MCLCVAWLLVSACGDDEPAQPSDSAPADPANLTPDGPTRDEDPSVLRLADDRWLVAWFSDRTGNGEIYVTATSDAASWASPSRVTQSGAGDFYPNLALASAGGAHLVWFRWTSPYLGHICYNRSTDGLTWDLFAEELVTLEGNVDDWAPTIVETAGGEILVFFVSRKRAPNEASNDLFMTRRLGPFDWAAPVPVPGVNSANEHDQLPFAARVGDSVRLVWVRHDTTAAVPWEARKSDLYVASSETGESWEAPVRMTTETEDVVHLFPAFFSDAVGAWSILWLSTRQGEPAVFEAPLDSIGVYPRGIRARSELPAGYSHRLAAFATPESMLAVWTQGEEGTQDIYYRIIER